MTRSRNLPLSISLGLPTDEQLNRAEDDQFDPGLEALVYHCDRWRSLEIYGGAIWLLDDPVFYTIKGRLPLLERLKIQQIFSASDVETHYDVFSECPRLTNIHTEWPSTYTQADSLLSLLELPWSQVRSWVLSVRDVATLLSKPCEGLERLRIDDVDADTPGNSSTDEESLVSNVSSLELVGDGKAAFLMHLLNITTFPQMSTLNVTGYISSWYSPLLNCLVHSSCTITCLSLHHDSTSGFDTNHIISLLRHTPMVRTFALESWALSQEFVQSFALSYEKLSTPNHLLPGLKDFTLWLHRVPEVEDTAIVDALASRWLPEPENTQLVGATCLRDVTIKLTGPELDPQNREGFFASDLPTLRDLRVAGMRIGVVSHR
ncbi:hypothetical protein V5O48_014010 [Marasmius crinis-equi]|uniref:F-box domain-containing protein n=1 Tax=Marasmius crinis-equi TaxID=585013 RepID=A0ABR3EYH8_9AGAR